MPDLNWNLLLEVCLAALVWGFCTAFVEAFAKPMVKRALQRRFLKVAPILLPWIDREARSWIAAGISSEEMDRRVRAFASELTGEDWSQISTEPVWEAFDLRKYIDHQRNPAADLLVDVEIQAFREQNGTHR